MELDLKDPIHVDLIQSAANIYATLFNLPMVKEADKVVEIARKIPLKPFQPKAGVKIETDEKKTKEEPVEINDEDEQENEKLLKQLTQYQINPKQKTQVIEFEKDDPTNFHIEFMGGVSNLRVNIYLCRQETTPSRK